jgi:hypothetical protein
MWIGCDVQHGFQQGRGWRGATLSARVALIREESGMCGWQAAALKTWQPKHRGGGAGQAPKPRSGAALPAGLYARRRSR